MFIFCCCLFTYFVCIVSCNTFVCTVSCNTLFKFLILCFIFSGLWQHAWKLEYEKWYMRRISKEPSLKSNDIRAIRQPRPLGVIESWWVIMQSPLFSFSSYHHSIAHFIFLILWTLPLCEVAKWCEHNGSHSISSFQSLSVEYLCFSFLCVNYLLFIFNLLCVYISINIVHL